MSINQRIKKIRKSRHLNQTEFADFMGLKHGAVSKMEKQGNTVTEQNRRLICEKFNISRQWLDTGEGEMYAEDAPPDLFENMRQEFHMTPIEEKILRNYFDMDEKERKTFTDFIQKLGKEPYKEAITGMAKPEKALTVAEKRKIANEELDLEEQSGGKSSASIGASGLRKRKKA